MGLTRVVPSGVERRFGEDDLIVSKTDPKGLIQYANRTFIEISGYEEADLIGKPHNIIRHPDMPRAVFKLLWDRITSGRELFAYIVNLASDGSHYWVYAHVTPSFGPAGTIVGFHSNRRNPNRGALGEVQRLYAELRAAEAGQPRPADALAAGTDRMHAFLSERGQTYDQWVWGLATDSTTTHTLGGTR